MKASIIIPSFNAKDRLYNNLISLNCQDYPFSNFEVIVIDNGSNDQTSEMISDFSANYSLITIRLEQNVGIAKGRNAGILQAAGDIIIFHDSDMIATKDFVRKHIEAHERNDHKSMVVCGSCWKRIYSLYYQDFELDHYHRKQFRYRYPLIRKKGIDKYRMLTEEQINSGDFLLESFDLGSSMMMSLKTVLQTFGEDLSGYKFPWRFFFTNNASIPRSVLLGVGLFDENNKDWGYEDYDLAIRLHKSGHHFAIHHDIVNVHQEHPINFTMTSFKDSTRYMLEKYNDIRDLDVLLIILTITIASIPPFKTIFDEHELNQIAKNIDTMINSSTELEILDQFREQLQKLCNKHLFLSEKKTRWKKTKLKSNSGKLEIVKNELIERTQQDHFVHAFMKIAQELD